MYVVRKMTEQTGKKILIIRMLEVGDVVSIGVSALRYIKKKEPDAEVHFLTYAKGAEIIKLAEPDVHILELEAGQWPDNIVQAMEAFLGIAEQIIGQAYTQILNFDTAFMPCFLSRFLKDAGEPVHGNYMNCSVQELIDQFQAQSLKAEFVNDPAEYMNSTFFGMARLHSAWWESVTLPEYGYPEFYLRQCCGYTDLEMDNVISLQADCQPVAANRPGNNIALSSADPVNKVILLDLQNLLEEKGYGVWWVDLNESIQPTLEKLMTTALLVATPGAEHWYASSVGCPSLLICGDLDPRILMPDYATEQGQILTANGLAESIESIFTEQNNG